MGLDSLEVGAVGQLAGTPTLKGHTMNLGAKIAGYGVATTGLLISGGVIVWREAHYWLTPAHLENLAIAGGSISALVIAAGGTAAVKTVSRKRKLADALEQLDELRAKQGLTESQPQAQPFHYDRADKRVIDPSRVN